MRVVVDPNVLVSAVVADGVSSQLIDRWLTDRPFQIVVCPMLTDELRDVLIRDKFRRWITVDEAELLIGRLEEEAEPWTDPTAVPPVTDDPKDDYLVALFSDSQADLLVSGDSDLLEITTIDVTVITPAQFLERL